MFPFSSWLGVPFLQNTFRVSLSLSLLPFQLLVFPPLSPSSAFSSFHIFFLFHNLFILSTSIAIFCPTHFIFFSSSYPLPPSSYPPHQLSPFSFLFTHLFFYQLFFPFPPIIFLLFLLIESAVWMRHFYFGNKVDVLFKSHLSSSDLVAGI